MPFNPKILDLQIFYSKILLKVVVPLCRSLTMVLVCASLMLGLQVAYLGFDLFHSIIEL